MLILTTLLIVSQDTSSARIVPRRFCLTDCVISVKQINSFIYSFIDSFVHNFVF